MFPRPAAFASLVVMLALETALICVPAPAHAQLLVEPDADRMPFAAFADTLQQETCAALWGDITRGAGALCLQQDVLAAYRTDQDEHRADVALCDAEGGVLVDRIPTCTEAMVHYLTTSSQYDADGNIAPLLEAYAAVSARCWGQWLCVE